MAAEELVGPIPKDWHYTTLGEACSRSRGDIQTGPFGSQLHAADYVPRGIPSIMPQNIGENRIVEEGIARITPADAQRLERYLVRTGDIVYSRRGDVERRAIVRKRENGWLCGTGCLRIRFGDNSVNPEFAAFYLGHPAVREWVVRHAHGATMSNLNTSILSACPLAVPPVEEQRAIARILAALDDKIELNRRMNETLEAIARALFMSWLGDQDVRRVSAGELEAEGVLEIGDGYRAKNSELGKPGMPFIRAGDLNDGFDTHGAEYLHEASVVKAGSKVAQVGDVAFTSKGTIGRFARVGEHSAPFVYSPQVCFWRSREPTHLHPAVLYCWMQSDDFIEQVMAVAGQTDMAPYVSLRDQRRMLIPRFSVSQSLIGDRIHTVLRRQSLASSESRVLAALRDTLLPKLVSGELRVRDVDRIVGGLS